MLAKAVCLAIRSHSVFKARAQASVAGGCPVSLSVMLVKILCVCMHAWVCKKHHLYLPW